jgi:hypothetical protein
MISIQEITAKIFAELPSQARFNKQDAECMAKHCDLLLQIDGMIKQNKVNS